MTGKLIVLDGESVPLNLEVADSLRILADRFEGDSKRIASYGIVVAYDDGTIGLEYGGRHLTTLIGGVTLLSLEIEKGI